MFNRRYIANRLSAQTYSGRYDLLEMRNHQSIDLHPQNQPASTPCTTGALQAGPPVQVLLITRSTFSVVTG